jgi:gliotoxin/aspirochlorine biosynthesis glutathione S-transferase
MGYPNRQNPQLLPETTAKKVPHLYCIGHANIMISRLRENCLAQWDRLDERLADPNQLFIALPDRPSIADISYFPFTLAWMFVALGVDMARWPHIKAWSQRLWNRPSFQCIMDRGPKYGHEHDRA